MADARKLDEWGPVSSTAPAPTSSKRPQVGPFQLDDLAKVYGADPTADIFEQRGISRNGDVVVVRPDQYVANVLPLTATADLAALGTHGRSTRRQLVRGG
ncbi:hypothetical protein NNX39_04680 [Arthrobacter sp. zg-Y826]|nr:hypothetical protein [Arthrobacter jinronghuae]MCQ1955800.1 hypothetical protein [Arthrobacter jinronghuae]